MDPKPVVREPTVTAVVVSYNQARFLPACLTGLGAQTRRPDQVIIVDDASSDSSQDLLRRWVAEHRADARLILHDHNQGVVRTLNEAYAQVTSDFVAPLAADDLWFPDKLAVQVRQLAALPEKVGVLYGDVERIDEGGVRLAGTFIEHYRGSAVLPEGDLFDDLLRGNFLASPSILMRHSVWREVGRFDESLYMEDWDFWLRVAKRFHFAVTDEPVGHYRVVTGSLVTGAMSTRKGAEGDLRLLLKWLKEPQMRSREMQARLRAAVESARQHGVLSRAGRVALLLRIAARRRLPSRSR